jgi:hypothetical protein
MAGRTAAVTVADVLELRGSGLTGSETWSLLCQATQALQDLFLSRKFLYGQCFDCYLQELCGLHARSVLFSVIFRMNLVFLVTPADTTYRRPCLQSYVFISCRFRTQMQHKFRMLLLRNSDL